EQLDGVKTSRGSSTSNCANDEQRLSACSNRFGKRGFGGLQREVFFACEEPEEGPALECVVVADGSAEHGVAGFEGVENGADGDGRWNFKCDVAVDMRKVAKVVRQ